MKNTLKASVILAVFFSSNFLYPAQPTTMQKIKQICCFCFCRRPTSALPTNLVQPSDFRYKSFDHSRSNFLNTGPDHGTGSAHGGTPASMSRRLSYSALATDTDPDFTPTGAQRPRRRSLSETLDRAPTVVGTHSSFRDVGPDNGTGSSTQGSTPGSMSRSPSDSDLGPCPDPTTTSAPRSRSSSVTLDHDPTLADIDEL